MDEIEIGGQLVPRTSFEAITQISSTRTLLVQQLTAKPDKKEQPVKELETIDDVFQHYKPTVKVGFEPSEGKTINEELKFTSLSDFGPQSIISQSSFLSKTRAKQDDYEKIVKELRTNKDLKSVLKEPELRTAFLQGIQAMIQEIDKAK